jgi:hypothetical protein
MRYILPEYSKGNPKETRPYFLTFVKKWELHLCGKSERKVEEDTLWCYRVWKLLS